MRTLDRLIQCGMYDGTTLYGLFSIHLQIVNASRLADRITAQTQWHMTLHTDWYMETLPRNFTKKHAGRGWVSFLMIGIKAKILFFGQFKSKKLGSESGQAMLSSSFESFRRSSNNDSRFNFWSRHFEFRFWNINPPPKLLDPQKQQTCEPRFNLSANRCSPLSNVFCFGNLSRQLILYYLVDQFLNKGRPKSEQSQAISEKKSNKEISKRFRRTQTCLSSLAELYTCSPQSWSQICTTPTKISWQRCLEFNMRLGIYFLFSFFFLFFVFFATTWP